MIWKLRTELLLGEDKSAHLAKCKVAVVGIGGVGSFAAEALARSGVGWLRLVDHDTVSETNINRQIHALTSTLGQPKVAVMAARARDINPEISVEALQLRYTEATAQQIVTADLDYVIDAVDTVTAKLHLINLALELDVPVISVMGTGNKLDPTRFEVADISRTSICPLARAVRKELGRKCIKRGVKVVYSKEEPHAEMGPEDAPEDSYVTVGQGPGAYRRQLPGSISFVPSVAGLIAAGEVVRELVTDCVTRDPGPESPVKTDRL
ncbi:MAG TPA: tRNA threonylcarbamoyladenosine dehydratase [Bacillota bacterium]|nr:tRNA threonylcarbamoyladenosine dehydratase [Bacillota bacterium]